MVNNNNNLINLIENKKPVELVQELKNETPSFEEFMKTYESDANLNYDDLKGGSVGEAKGYGPMYRASSDSNNYYSVKYSFNQSDENYKNFFEKSGSYSSTLEISGSLMDVKEEQWKLENGKIRVVKLNSSNSYEKNASKEEEVKDRLRRDIWDFERGKATSATREFNDKNIFSNAVCVVIGKKDTRDCPGCQKELQYTENRK